MNSPAAWRKLWTTRWWGLALAAMVALVATDTVYHLRTTWDFTWRNNPAPPVADSSSPSGYAYNQHVLILPYTGMDGYHWIMQTQQMLAGGGARIRYVDYDNAPDGREVHWASALRWWMAGLAWIDHVYTGTPIALAVEEIAPFASTLLVVLLIALVTPFMARRFGSLPAALFAFGAVGVGPFYESFTEGRLDHHGLAALNALLSLLFLAGGAAGWVRTSPATNNADTLPLPLKLPDRPQAKRWFVAAGIAGGIGLWISAASEAPVLAEIGLGALLATGLLGRGIKKNEGAQPDPSLWRVWGWSGAATSVFFYLLEYFPSHLGMRLEVNHPLYALAWAGGGEIIFRVCRWWNGDKLAAQARDWAWLAFGIFAISAIPALVLIAADKVFWVNDRFLWTMHNDYIEEFFGLWPFLKSQLDHHLYWIFIIMANPLVLLAVPMMVWMWRQLRVFFLIGVVVVSLLYWGIMLYEILYKHAAIQTEITQFQIFLDVNPKAKTAYFLAGFALLLSAGVLPLVVATLCLLRPQWEKIILLASLALGLLTYDLFLWSCSDHLLANYFWSLQILAILVSVALLGFWEPWQEFPRPACALLLLTLPPGIITFGLSVLQVRWTEINYSLWLAVLVTVAIVLQCHRAYRWTLMPMSLLTGLTTMVLGEFELLASNLPTVGVQATPSLATQAALQLAIHVMSAVAILALLWAIVGRFLNRSWQTITRTSLLMLMPPLLLVFALWAAQLHWLHPNWTVWLDIECAPWLAALLAVVVALCLQHEHRWKTRARTFAAVVLLGWALLPSPVFMILTWVHTGWKAEASDVEDLELVVRDSMQKLRTRVGSENALVLSGPTSSTWITYYGGFKTLGTYYWENLQGMKAAAKIYGATYNEAVQLIAARQITHLVVFSFVDNPAEYSRLARGLRGNQPAPEDAFVWHMQQAGLIPQWLRPIYYPMPSGDFFKMSNVSIYEFSPRQTAAEALTRLAEVQMESNHGDTAANLLHLALERDPACLPALITLTRLQLSSGQTTEFNSTVARLRLLTPMAGTLELGDRVDLADVLGRAQDTSLMREQVQLALHDANSQTMRKLRIDSLFNLLYFTRSLGLLDQHPGLWDVGVEILSPGIRQQLFVQSADFEKSAGHPRDAVALLHQALAIAPDSLMALDRLALLLCSSPDESVRDGKEAVAVAEHAYHLDQLKHVEITDVLACAYAEIGDFVRATQLEQQAITAADPSTQSQEISILRAHLTLFQNKKPLRF